MAGTEFWRRPEDGWHRVSEAARRWLAPSSRGSPKVAGTESRGGLKVAGTEFHCDSSRRIRRTLRSSVSSTPAGTRKTTPEGKPISSGWLTA
jgi:hypothetical protein